MSAKHRTILLYGDSVFIAGLGETLRAHANFDVVSVIPKPGRVALAGFQPDVVLVDAAQFSPNQVEGLMGTFQPGKNPPFLSLNATDMCMTVVTSRQYPATNQDDLAQVLDMLSNCFPFI